MMIPQICNASKVGEGVLSILLLLLNDTVLSIRTVWLKVDLLVVGCAHHEDALHAEGVGDVRSRAGALCPPTI